MSYETGQKEIFHGSTKEICVFEIRLDMNLLPCDFGNGFYTTPNILEAVAWALLKNPQILVVNKYEMDLEALAGLKVLEYEESLEWYNAVREGRRTSGFTQKADVIIAPVATAYDIEMMKQDIDDKTIESYLQDAPQKRETQIVFLTSRAIENCLTYIGADKIRRGDDYE